MTEFAICPLRCAGRLQAEQVLRTVDEFLPITVGAGESEWFNVRLFGLQTLAISFGAVLGFRACTPQSHLQP